MDAETELRFESVDGHISMLRALVRWLVVTTIDEKPHPEATLQNLAPLLREALDIAHSDPPSPAADAVRANALKHLEDLLAELPALLAARRSSRA